MSVAFLDRLLEARFDELLARAMNGTPLILRSRLPDTLERLVARAGTGPLSLDVVPVERGTAEPGHSLFAAASELGETVGSLAEFSAAANLRFTLFVVDAGGDAEGWLMLAGTLASLREHAGNEGPALVVRITSGRAPNKCQLLDDSELFGPAEAAVYARGHRAIAGLLDEGADAAAIEAARGDILILDRLLRLPTHQRFDPSAWAASRPPEGPQAIRWRGRDELCPIWLARNDMARLRRRIWRGHVSVFFPWLAEGLGAFLAAHGTRLPEEIPDRFGDEPIRRENYEWGHIAWILKRAGPGIAPHADALRYLRNDLAHGRPLSWPKAARAEAHARKLLDWS